MTLLSEFLHDFRLGFRRLCQHPWAGAVAIFMLILGLGANTGVFCFMNAVFLRPLPLPRPAELVLISEVNPQVSASPMKSSWANFEDWRREARSLVRLAAYRDERVTVLGAGDPDVVEAQAVSREFFSVLGVAPVLGRAIGSEREAVISHAYWETRFGRTGGVLGTAIRLEGRPYSIVGVMPPGFRLVHGADFWYPLEVSPERRAMRGARFVLVVGRLLHGVKREAAQARLDAVARGLAEAHPENAGWGVLAASLEDRLLGPFRRRALSLFAAAALILLIACTNLVCLQLAQAESRKREFAVRMALGAGRGRLMRQLFAETLLVAFLGTAPAIAVAWGVLKLLAVAGPANLPVPVAVTLDGRAVAYACALAVCSALLVALYPALRLRRLDFAAEAQGRSESSVGGSSGWTKWGALMAGEIALAQILLAGAGLSVHSFLNLSGIDPGFRASGVIVARIPLSVEKYPDGLRQARFFAGLAQEAQRLASVRSVGLVNVPPLDDADPKGDFGAEGRPKSASFWASVRVVTPGYFSTMGVPLLAGRTFSPFDTAGSPRVVVISEAAVRRIFGRENPLGKKLCWDVCDLEIVGVAGNVRHSQLQETRADAVYLAFSQSPQSRMALVLHTDSSPSEVSQSLRPIVRSLDRDQPVESVERLQDVVRRALFQPILSAGLISVFAALGLAMALGGVYGVASYVVDVHTHEIGVRVALGATNRQLLRPLLRWGAAAAVAGALAGLAGAFLFARLLGALLYDAPPLDPPVLICCAATLCATVLLACYLAARRISRIDPLCALRY